MFDGIGDLDGKKHIFIRGRPESATTSWHRHAFCPLDLPARDR